MFQIPVGTPPITGRVKITATDSSGASVPVPEGLVLDLTSDNDDVAKVIVNPDVLGEFTLEVEEKERDDGVADIASLTGSVTNAKGEVVAVVAGHIVMTSDPKISIGEIELDGFAPVPV